MSYPKTYHAIRRSAETYPLTLDFTQETLPDTFRPNDVLIRIHAASLNYRDVAMLREGKYPIPVNDRKIMCSCCAASLIALGSSVTKFQLGDCVVPTVNLHFLTGEERDAEVCALAADAPGILREYAVFGEEELVLLPAGLGWEENALDGLEQVPKDATALLQGTGGVSIMALLLCLAAGIHPIITSSSDAKLSRLTSLHPSIKTINYKTTPDIAAEVLRLTNGKSVDYVLNNMGLSSIPTDLVMLRKYGGSIALIGFLEGFEAGWEPGVLVGLIMKAARIKYGLLVGSRADFKSVRRFIEEKKVSLKPLVDRVFEFKEARKSREAFEYLESGSHVGKVVVKM